MVFLRGYLPKCTIKISLWYIATAYEDATFWGKKRNSDVRMKLTDKIKRYQIKMQLQAEKQCI